MEPVCAWSLDSYCDERYVGRRCSVAEFVQQHMSLTNETAVELRHNRDANYLFVKTTAGHSGAVLIQLA